MNVRSRDWSSGAYLFHHKHYVCQMPTNGATTGAGPAVVARSTSHLRTNPMSGSTGAFLATADDAVYCVQLPTVFYFSDILILYKSFAQPMQSNAHLSRYFCVFEC